MHPSFTGGRNLSLDVLRGVAILLVFGRHLQIPRPDGLVGLFADGWFRLGWIGVDLFFVLSGFLIGGLLVSEVQKTGRIDIARFLIRRGFKIYPVYYVFIAYLITVPVLGAWISGQDHGTLLARQWSLYWPNLLFLQNYVGSNPAGHTWSLAVEEHFYILLPILLTWLVATDNTRSILAACVVAMVVILGLRVISVLTVDQFSVRMAATHLRLDALLCGVALRIAAQSKPAWFLAARDWRGSLVVFGSLCWVPNLFIEPSSPWIRTLGLTATYLGSGAFLLAAFHTHRDDFGRASSLVYRAARGFAWIGVYSYAIYVWHVTAMGFTERQLGKLGSRFADSSAVDWALAASVVCTSAVVTGVIVTRVVERPVLAIRERWFPSFAGSASGIPASIRTVESPPAGSWYAKPGVDR